MLIPDERSTTFVAFLDGYDNAASGYRTMREFAKFLSDAYYGARQTNIAWWGHIAEHIAPDRPQTRTSLGDLEETASEPLIAEMLDRLEEFLRDRRRD